MIQESVILALGGLGPLHLEDGAGDEDRHEDSEDGDDRGVDEETGEVVRTEPLRDECLNSSFSE
jgi:hypothetical protein